jgi:hypothetical protein
MISCSVICVNVRIYARFPKKIVKKRGLRVVNFASNGVKWILRIFVYTRIWPKDRCIGVNAGQYAHRIWRVDGPLLLWGRFAIDPPALR